MTPVVAGFLVVVAVAVVAAIYIFLNRGRSEISLDAGKAKLRAKGSNDRLPDARIVGSTSQQGGAEAISETGDGALIENTNVQGDLRAVSQNPNRPDPKA